LTVRIACRAVFLDAGGVIVLPDRGLVASALAGAGIDIDPAAVPRAHYRAVRRLDRGEDTRTVGGYFGALCLALGVPARRAADGIRSLSQLADRSRSGQILWSEPTPGAAGTIAALMQAGISVVVLSNSDGHAAENLRDASICQIGAGPGVPITDVIDSALVGVAKPDPEIFRIALRAVEVAPDSVVHVGDTLSADIAGARAARILPIHFDPTRTCRATDHRHIRSLSGVSRHVAMVQSPAD
jgi:putative hydrolase of the HAD superfamily